MRKWWLAVALWGLAIRMAAAQGGIPEGDVTVDVSPVYLSMYRDGTWIPLDLLVVNGKADISGSLAVETYANGILQSPVYHVPVESPKGSRKRFRVYCMLRGVDEIRVMLYHKNRPALSIPIRMPLRPIRRKGLFCLVLDDEKGRYGFLHRMVTALDSEQSFHKIDLSTEELATLPDRQACYEPFDLIVMGEIDPERIASHHRDLLRAFVARGGTLVVCLGENAARYRGSWVVDLMGVHPGGLLTLEEREVISAVFHEPPPDAPASGSRCILSELRALGPGIRARGKEPVLAALAELGQGHVVTLALDPSAEVLRRSPGYRAMWAEILGLRSRCGELNFGAATEDVLEALPRIVGVRIASAGSVMLYLGLYVFFGIVLNWLFWSFFKRREMAWVCLVFISLGFTTYAVMVGGGGRATSDELVQIQVVQVPRHGANPHLHSLAGVLTTRTARFDLEIPWANSLVSEPYAGGVFYGDLGNDHVRPFTWIQGRNDRVESFAVGASELRLLSLDSPIPETGGLDGKFILQEGRLEGAVTNNTGYRLGDVYLLYEGHIYRLNLRGGNVWEPATGRPETGGRWGSQELQMRRYGRYRHSGSWNDLRDMLATTLFLEPTTMNMLDPTLGPLVFGWAEQPALDAIRTDEPIPNRVTHMLLVADVSVETPDAGAPSEYALPVEIEGGRHASHAGYVFLNTGSTPRISVTIPPRLRVQEQGTLRISALCRGPHEPDEFPLSIVNEEGSEVLLTPISCEVATQAQPIEEGCSMILGYRIPEWRSYYDETVGMGIHLSVPSVPRKRNGNTAAPAVGEFTIRAQLVVELAPGPSEQWKWLKP